MTSNSGHWGGGIRKGFMEEMALKGPLLSKMWVSRGWGRLQPREQRTKVRRWDWAEQGTRNREQVCGTTCSICEGREFNQGMNTRGCSACGNLSEIFFFQNNPGGQVESMKQDCVYVAIIEAGNWLCYSLCFCICSIIFLIKRKKEKEWGMIVITERWIGPGWPRKRGNSFWRSGNKHGHSHRTSITLTIPHNHCFIL